ncbi:MAG: vWA domain-containing protein [Myxococcota bacterium]
MTDDVSNSESVAPRRRRYPLTLTTLAGSAIAIPLYVAATAMNSASPTADGETTVAQSPTATADNATVEEAKTAIEVAPVVDTPIFADEPSDAERVTGEARDMPSFMPTEVRTKAEAAPSEAPPPPAMPKSARSSSSTARHAGILGMMGKPGSGTKGMSGGMAFGGEGRGGGGLAEDSAFGGPMPDTGVGYDEQLRAGQLTAGILDDLSDTTLLDELRDKATALDGGIAQAIPSHKAKGAAPNATTTAPVLEIGFVVDTTGSMGDELQYLKTEVRSIAQEIGRQHPNVEQRYGLVVYRDQTDEYLVRHHDFEPLDAFVDHLGVYGAGGGGDFPEAMDEGMKAASTLQWSGDQAAKLVFVLADAPPHAAGYQTYVHATGSLASKNVSVYPVASSGVEPICEYLMRWAARTTGGKYLFLTDHSGIGNAHADPHADDYELKSLRAHMLDVIQAELGQGPMAVPAADGPTPVAPPTQVDVNVEIHGESPSWMQRHGLFMMILGGVFLLGFAGDMAMSSVRRRR